MRLKRVENSIAFWALSLLVYGLCFSLIRAQAEALYRKTPRLTPRTRMETPKISPMLHLNPDSRIHSTPPPSVYSELVPVSWQPEKNSPPAPKGSPQPMPSKPTSPDGSRSTRPKSQYSGQNQRIGQSKRIGKVTDWQPAVVIPPRTNKITGATVPKPVTSRATTLGSSKIQSSRSGNTLKLSAAPKGKIYFEEAVALQATATSGSHQSGDKPLVHFPQDLPDTRSSGKSTMEPGFYPVGYRPYLPASIVVVSGKHQEALSHYNRGSYYGHANQLREAILEYQKAIRKNPNLADAYVGLSSAYLLKNQWEDVFINARKALSLKTGFMDPANIIQAKYNLSTAYCAADDYGQAKFFYNSVKMANHAQTAELWEYLKKNCRPKP